MYTGRCKYSILIIIPAPSLKSDILNPTFLFVEKNKYIKPPGQRQKRYNIVKIQTIFTPDSYSKV